MMNIKENIKELPYSIPFLSHRKEEKRKRESRRFGGIMYESVQQGRITPHRAFEVMSRAVHWADSHQARVGYRRSQALHDAEVQRLTAPKRK